MLLAALATPLIPACVDTSLGPCNMEVAERVAFVHPDEPWGGLPAYEGQALFHSCGGGALCHAPAAEGRARLGAPFGLDFDVRLACESDLACTPDGIDRLTLQRAEVLRRTDLLIRALARGTMPVRRRDVPDPTYIDTAGEPLPRPESRAGRAIVKNWLACGAPVVETSASPYGALGPGDECGYGAGGVGPCIVRGPANPPEPTWASIYARVFEPACRSCHGAGPLARLDTSQLDLGDADTAHAALIDAPPSSDGDCGLADAPLVQPGSAEGSLLVHKLDGTARCGDVMPPEGQLGDETLARIRQWIDGGALP